MVVVEEGQSASFTIPDVPVLGDPSVFSQGIILQWSSESCSAGIEYAFPTAMVGNGAVDLGTIIFVAADCSGDLVFSEPNDLSWDGLPVI